MIPVSTEYINAVYAPVREFKARAKFKLDSPNVTLKEITQENFKDKISGQSSPKSSIAKYRSTTLTLTKPADFTVEATQAQYDGIAENDGLLAWVTTSSSASIRIHQYFGFDIINILTRKYGEGIWRGRNDLAGKISIAKGMITRITLKWTGYGNGKGGNKATVETFHVRDNKWDVANGKSHTSGSYSTLTLNVLSTFVSNTPANKIDADGFFHAWAYNEKNDATTPVSASLRTQYVELEIETNVKYYDDDTIIRLNILEEISTINETLSSNELQLTMDNSSGDFDLLNFQNMSKILGSKPEISVDLGLVTERIAYGRFAGELNINKSYNGVDNAGEIQVTTINSDKVYHPNGSAFPVKGNTEIGTAFEGSATGTREIMYIGQDFSRFAATKPYDFYSEDFVYFRRTGEKWEYAHNSGTYYEFVPNFDYDCVIGTFTKTTTTAASGIDTLTKYGETKYEVTTEWIPCGHYFLTSWENDLTSKIITLTANDYFALFSETNYEPKGIVNLKDLAIDVLTTCGVPPEYQIIDNSLSLITVNPFPERLDCRTALQHIGIAGRVSVSQDRNGNIVLSPFKHIDEESNYQTYPTTQPTLYGYLGPDSYIRNDTGSGMRYLDFNEMYEPPRVSLQKSIHQLVIKVYAGGEPVEYIYVNAEIEGNSGLSFTIDNPLVNSVELSNKIATWFIREINYNALYTVSWRQNPAIECTDMILVEDSFGAEKQSRVIRQEINYQGYLEGVTESRGGV